MDEFIAGITLLDLREIADDAGYDWDFVREHLIEVVEEIDVKLEKIPTVRLALEKVFGPYYQPKKGRPAQKKVEHGQR